jgi:isopenicillin N synthase-like dioxygenase
MNKIPSVNLADFLSDNENRKQQFISEIGHAYENIGFVALKVIF